MRYLSVCSGMEAASVAWEPLGFKPVGFSEIEPFPSAILKHRFPNVPNYGNLEQHAEWPIQPGSVDILVGGTPCQSFSVAGLRRGLADPRGNLSLVFLGLADRLKPKWIVWENVPGFLSADGGRCAGSFLGALGELGYGWAYRVLDAQNFGVPQRRRRVFVVGCLGDQPSAAKVLFEPESLCWDTQTRNKKRQDATADTSQGPGIQGERVAYVRNNTLGPIEQSGCVTTSTERHDFATDTFIVEAYRKSRRAQSDKDFETWVDDGKANTINLFENTDVRTTHAIVEPKNIMFKIRCGAGENTGSRGSNKIGQKSGTGYLGQEEKAFTLNASEDQYLATSFQVWNLLRDASAKPSTDHFCTVKAGLGDQMPCVNHEMVVRRLTPVECERLQGFPDNWSRIPWRGRAEEDCPDGPRYAACGNSMAVPVMRWIGERIQAVNSEKQ